MKPFLHAILQSAWFSAPTSNQADYHSNSPECLVRCIALHRSNLPYFAPDEYYDQFTRDQDTAGCFHRDPSFLKEFSKCIAETCDSQSAVYRAIHWGYDTYLAQAIALLNHQTPAEKFGTHIPGNTCPPGYIMIPNHGAALPIVDEDGNVTILLSEAEHSSTPKAGFLFVTSITIIFFVTFL